MSFTNDVPDCDYDPGFDIDLFSSQWEADEAEAVHKSLLEGINTPNRVCLTYPDTRYHEAMTAITNVLRLPEISSKKVVNNCYPSAEKIDAAIAFICAAVHKKDDSVAPWS